MVEKPLTIKACTDEMERLIKIILYSKCSEAEKNQILELIKNCIEEKGRLEQKKADMREETRARRERERYGIRDRRQNG